MYACASCWGCKCRLQTAAVLSLFKRFWSTSRLKLYRWLKKLIAIVILKSFPQVSISWMGSSNTGRTVNSSNETEVGPKESWNWNKAVAKFSLNWRCLESSEPGIYHIIQYAYIMEINIQTWIRDISILPSGQLMYATLLKKKACLKKNAMFVRDSWIFFHLQEETI